LIAAFFLERILLTYFGVVRRRFVASSMPNAAATFVPTVGVNGKSPAARKHRSFRASPKCADNLARFLGSGRRRTGSTVVAKNLGMSVNAVYKAKARVLHRLRIELHDF
jgi:hypothetical protein